MTEKEVFSNLKEVVKVRKEISERKEKENSEEIERKHMANLPENVATRVYNEIMRELYSYFLEALQNITNEVQKANDIGTNLCESNWEVTYFLKELLSNDASDILVKMIREKLNNILQDNELDSIIEAGVIYCVDYNSENEDSLGWHESVTAEPRIVIIISLK